LNSNGVGKEKRARRVVTRPEPTIYGNCDSWNFIVGKKPRQYRRGGAKAGSLQASNRSFIHSLSTKLVGKCWDNMWAICGSAVQHPKSSRIVVGSVFDMRLIADAQDEFYRKTSLAQR
jgi:hypothetical protein